METLFAVLLGVGVGYAVLSFAFGEFLGPGDSNGMLPLKSSILASFIIVFGGSGLLFLRTLPPLTAIPLAGLSGAAVAFVFYRFIAVPLSKAQSPTAVEIQSLVGHLAKVTEKIPQGKYGKITYIINESTYTAPAKAEDGKEIERNTPVEIVYIEKSTYYVRPKA